MTQGIDAVKARNGRKAPVPAPTATVVVDPNGNGDVRTISEAIILLPLGGGYIQLSPGIHSIASTITVPAGAKISIRGAAATAFSGVAPTQILVDAAVAIAFDISANGSFDFHDVVVQFMTAGQTLFRATACTNTCYLTNSTLNGNLTTGKVFTVIGGGFPAANLHLTDSYISVGQVCDGACTVWCVNSTITGGYAVGTAFNAINSILSGVVGGLNIGSSVESYFFGCLLTTTVVGSILIASTMNRFVGCKIIENAHLVVVSGSQNDFTGCVYGGVGLQVTGNANIFNGMSINGNYAISESGLADYNHFSEIETLAAWTYTVTLLGAHSVYENANALPVSTTPYAVTIRDRTLLVNAAGGARVVSLPAAASSRHRIITVKKIDLTANTVSITPNAAELIEGANAPLILSAPNEIAMIQCDGSAWYVIG